MLAYILYANSAITHLGTGSACFDRVRGGGGGAGPVSKCELELSALDGLVMMGGRGDALGEDSMIYVDAGRLLPLIMGLRGGRAGSGWERRAGLWTD